MVEIRYWSNAQINNTSSSRSALNSNPDIALASDPKLFELMMSSMLLNSGDSSSQNPFDLNSSFSEYYSSLLNDKELQSLTKIKDEGMGKVFAARIANQLPVFSQMNSNSSLNKQNTDIAGLDSLISLNIQQQMIKTRQLIESQTKQIVANQPKVTQTNELTRLVSADNGTL